MQHDPTWRVVINFHTGKPERLEYGQVDGEDVLNFIALFSANPNLRDITIAIEKPKDATIQAIAERVALHLRVDRNLYRRRVPRYGSAVRRINATLVRLYPLKKKPRPARRALTKRQQELVRAINEHADRQAKQRDAEFQEACQRTFCGKPWGD